MKLTPEMVLPVKRGTSPVIKVLDGLVITITVLALILTGIFTVPRLFAVRPLVVESGSMEPAIPTGSVVFVNEKDREPEKGEVVTVSLPGSGRDPIYVTHRVSEVTTDGEIETKGDANDNPDGYLPVSSVIGTVLFHFPKAGLFLTFLQKSHGYLILVGTVLFLNICAVLVTACKKD